jgi:transposase
MRKIHLTTETKLALESRHRKCSDKRESDRIKAVLLCSKGWSAAMIAQTLLLHETSILRHVDDYIDKNKLSPKSGGSECHLNQEKIELLIAHLSEMTYVHTYQICCYIKEQWSVCYSVSGMNKWLHQNGFSYKQPKGVPHKFDSSKQAEFIEKYEALKASVADDEPILFMDAVHPTQATKVTRGWIRTGIDKIINTTGSRTRLNIIGAIRLGHLADTVTAQYKTINGESVIEFLERVREQYITSGRLHLVLDGAGYHRSQLVKDKAESLNIELHYLPPYSPNLNPIERLWKVLNEHARNNQYFATAKAFRQQIDKFFEVTLPKIGNALNGRINDNFQTFNPAL